MKNEKKLKQFPIHKTDEEAERFVDEVDLSEYDFSSFKPVRFEFLKKSARLELRLPEDQLKALKQAAKQQGIPYTRLVRQLSGDAGIAAMMARWCWIWRTVPTPLAHHQEISARFSDPADCLRISIRRHAGQ